MADVPVTSAASKVMERGLMPKMVFGPEAVFPVLNEPIDEIVSRGLGSEAFKIGPFVKQEIFSPINFPRPRLVAEAPIKIVSFDWTYAEAVKDLAGEHSVLHPTPATPTVETKLLSAGEIVRLMKENGGRPVTLREFLSMVIAQPEEWQNGDIAILGDAIEGNTLVPMYSGKNRALGLVTVVRGGSNIAFGLRWHFPMVVVGKTATPTMPAAIAS